MPEDPRSPPVPARPEEGRASDEVGRPLAPSLRDGEIAKLQKRMRDVAQFFPRFVIEQILEPIEFEEDESALFEGRTRESVPLHANVNSILKSFRQECAALEERLRGAGRDDLAAEARRAAGMVRDTASSSRVGDVKAMLDGAASVLESASARLA